MTVSDWASNHGFRRESVYAVLGGRSRCRRGEAHQIAVALRLKAGAPAENDWEACADACSPGEEASRGDATEEPTMT
jgi:gp16 family phage-associated protein